MTGDEFRAVRFKLGLSALQWGQALGYAGTTHNIRNQIRRYEHELRPIPPWIERLAWMYGEHGLPKEYASIGSKLGSCPNRMHRHYMRLC
jgi:transcriptional regulator with XRE-family HTH domain